MATIVYGASDDLVEIEGDLREEFYTPEDGAMYLAFSTGVMLSITYTADGIWSIRHLAGPEVVIVRTDGSDNGETDADGCPDYSDKATIEGAIWVVGGPHMVRRSPAPAVSR